MEKHDVESPWYKRCVEVGSENVDALEMRLMSLNQEKNEIESILMKFPAGTAGKTIAKRNEKVQPKLLKPPQPKQAE